MERWVDGALLGALASLLAPDRPVGACMEAMAQLGHEHRPHEAWERFGAIDYDGDVARLHDWIPAAVRATPPARPVRGLFLPLVGFEGAASPWRQPTSVPSYYDIRLAGTARYAPGDPGLLWLDHQTYEPRRRYARSQALLEMARIAQSVGPADNVPFEEGRVARDLSSFIDHLMPLAFNVAAVRSLLAPHTSALFGSDEPMGVAVGWEEGDVFEIGRLTAAGFRPDSPPS